MQQLTGRSRKDILVRLLFSILYLVINEIVRVILQLCVLAQYVWLLVFLDVNGPIQRFSNRLAAYGYRVMRYAAVVDNAKPFPFRDFPAEIDPPSNDSIL
jgi:hypothetical protein